MKTSSQLRLPLGLAIATALALSLGACGKSSDSGQTAPANATSAATSVPVPVTHSPMEPALPSSANPPVSAYSVPASATSAPAAASTSAAAAAKPLSVADVSVGSSIGKDYKVTKAADRFRADDHTLYAAVSTTGAATGANLGALWTYQDGQKVNQITQSITAKGPATTTFKVHNRNDWPEGKYKVAISLDGKAVSTKQFEVVKR